MRDNISERDDIPPMRDPRGKRGVDFGEPPQRFANDLEFALNSRTHEIVIFVSFEIQAGEEAGDRVRRRQNVVEIGAGITQQRSIPDLSRRFRARKDSGCGH